MQLSDSSFLVHFINPGLGFFIFKIRILYGTNEPFTEKKTMDLENRLVVAEGEGEGVGVGVGWIGSLGLIDADYLEWISHEILLCSPGNYI